MTGKIFNTQTIGSCTVKYICVDVKGTKLHVNYFDPVSQRSYYGDWSECDGTCVPSEVKLPKNVEKEAVRLSAKASK